MYKSTFMGLTIIYIFVSLYLAAFGAVLHVLSTSLLGITAITISNTIAGEETVHKLASLLLVFLGGSYIILILMGKGSHGHTHNQPMEKMAVAGLILAPCVPVFLAVGNSYSMTERYDLGGGFDGKWEFGETDRIVFA